MAEIILQNVGYSYAVGEQESVSALFDVSLKIVPGEFVALLGANGSGKSTMAKLLNGLLLPDKGEVLVDGMSTRDEAHTFDIRRRVGMVFQNPDNQMIASIVEDDVAFGPENLGIPREEIVRRVDWALEAVGMLEHKTDTPFKMSGGQKQRISIASVLAMMPEVLVMDESTAMLDPKGRREVLEILRDLNATGITVILITHYMDEVQYASRAVVLEDGRVRMDTTPDALFDPRVDIRSMGLEFPPLLSIEQQLLAAGVTLDGTAKTAEELAAQIAEVICR